MAARARFEAVRRREQRKASAARVKSRSNTRDEKGDNGNGATRETVQESFDISKISFFMSSYSFLFSDQNAVTLSGHRLTKLGTAA